MGHFSEYSPFALMMMIKSFEHKPSFAAYWPEDTKLTICDPSFIVPLNVPKPTLALAML
jgi:hypothetical protein